MSYIVTLFLVIYSDTQVSARTQRMTMAECQAEFKAARASVRADEHVTGGCIERVK